jgi:hypothetical protein
VTPAGGAKLPCPAFVVTTHADEANREVGGRRPWESIERLMTPVAAVVVATFLVWLLLVLGQVVANVYLSSDAAAPLVFAQDLDHRGAGEVVIGNSPWYEPLYALKLTSWLPSHEQAWKIGPFLLYGLTVLIAAWTVARAVSLRAGALVALAMAAPAPAVLLWVIGPPNSHGHTLFHAVLLSAFLVTLPGLEGWRWPGRCLWVIALAITLAPGASSDVILLLAGVLPFLAAAAFATWAGIVQRATGAIVGLACLAGTAAGLVIARVVETDGVRTTGAAFPPAAGEEVFANLRRILEDVASFAHGRLGGDAQPLNTVLKVTALVVMVAVPVIAYRGRHRLLEAVGSKGRPAEQRLLAVYWASACAAVTLAFVFSSAPEDGLTSIRYMMILWPGLLILGCILYGRHALAVIASVAAVSAVLGCFELARGDYTQPMSTAPRGAELAEIERFVTSNGAHYGYAAYWDALVLTVQTDFDVWAYPVQPCGERNLVCPFGISMESWYGPRPNTRSFYLVNPDAGAPKAPAPPQSWGPPVATRTIGRITVYVYDFDLAAEL